VKQTKYIERAQTEETKAQGVLEDVLEEILESFHLSMSFPR